MTNDIHLDKWYFRSYPTGGKFRDGAACGNGSAHCRITNDLKNVTCPECVKQIPKIWRTNANKIYDTLCNR
jgi:hypothetical protein